MTDPDTHTDDADDAPIVLEVERLVPCGVRTLNERLGAVRYLSGAPYVRACHSPLGRELGEVLAELARTGHPFSVVVVHREVPLVEWMASG